MGGATGSWSDNFRTSDEILDTAREGLDFFQRFIPVYPEAARVAGLGAYPGISMQNDISRPYDELRGIDFSMMRTDAEHLRTAIESADNHQHNLDRYWSALSGWTGNAADAARAHRDRFDGMATGFLLRARRGPSAIAGGVAAIERSLSLYTGNVKSLKGERCADMTPQEVLGAIQTARGDIEGVEAKWFLAKILDIGSGFTTFGIGWLADFFGFGASDRVEEARRQMMQAAVESLRNFVREFDAKKAAFDRWTELIKKIIQRHYDIMLRHLQPMTEEAFKDLPDPVPFGQSPTTPQGAGSGTTRPQVPTVPGGTQTSPGSGGPPAGAGPGQQPPSVTPGVPPGGPAVPNQPRTVTITSGDSTITVSSPDGQGRVKLIVDDGSGTPKTYDLDFGRSTAASGATPSLGGPSQTVPPMPSGGSGIGTGSGGGTPPIAAIPPVGGGTGSGSRTGTGSGTGSRPGSSVTPPAPRLPSSLFPWSDKPGEPLLPDEDGKVVIKDGEVTITVDSDEASDKLTLTLDDGKGHQTTYTVDYQDPAHPKLQEGGAHLFGPTGGSFTPGSHLSGVGSIGESLAGSIPSSGSLPGPVPVGAVPGGGGGGGGIGAGLAASASGPGHSEQLQPGAVTGQVGATPSSPAPGAVAAQSAPGGGGGQRGGGGAMGMPMMGMAGAAGQGGEDKERGPNQWLDRQDVISDDAENRRRAVKAGGVIGEDKKK